MTSTKALFTDTFEQIWALFIPVKETTNGYLHFIFGPFSVFYLSHCVFFFGYHLRVIVMRSISMLGMIIGQSGFLGPQAFFLHRNGMMKALEVQYWRYYYPVLFSSRLPLRICRRGKEHG